MKKEGGRNLPLINCQFLNFDNVRKLIMGELTAVISSFIIVTRASSK